MIDAKKYSLPRCTPLFSILFITLSILFSASAGAEMNELSEIQNGIFHLSPRSYEFSADTDKADQYIDDEQAEFFIAAANIPKNIEADGNYPFSLVDHRILDSDLEIVLDTDKICCPYPKVMYLSRHNISITDYTNERRPPRFYINNATFKEPFHHQTVDGVYWKLTDYEVIRNEALHKSVTPGEDCYTGYMVDGYVRSSGCVTVWVGETFSLECPQPKTPAYTGKCNCCNSH
jgi:hypothetical protein